MLTPWYKVSGEAAREALVSLSLMPSVDAAAAGISQPVGGAGAAARSSAAAFGMSSASGTSGSNPTAKTGSKAFASNLAGSHTEKQCETFTTVVDGVCYTYAVAPGNAACIVGCPDDPVNIAIPGALDGHPVAAIGPHAFCTCYKLEHAKMPDGLEAIGEYAFMNTALEEFVAPATLQTIGKNAFYKCGRLKLATLNDGLRVIDEGAFRESAISALDIPEHVGFIGHDAFKSTALAFGGNAPTLHIAHGNERYRLDAGALYVFEGSKAALVQVLDTNLAEYATDLPVVAVAAKAFAGLKHLRCVTLPEGVRAIGNEAFRGCSELEEVVLPDSVEHIGTRAFMDTKLAFLRIPAALETIGVAAFYTGGSIARFFTRTIDRIEISPDNNVFYLSGGILCQRRADDGDLAVLYAGRDDTVELPQTVSAIGAYAFLNASHVRKLHIHDGINGIDVGGFDFGHAAPTVIYDIVNDAERKGERYVIAYPPGQAGRLAARQAFSRGYFNLEYAFAGADNAIMTTRDVFIRSKGMLERLRNPVLLHENVRASFESALGKNLNSAVVAFGRNGFAQGIDWLYEAGMIDGDTIDGAIEAASDAGEIAVLSRLVELRRTAFSAPLFDFDL